MTSKCRVCRAVFACALLAIVACQTLHAAPPADFQVDFRYAVPWWQTAICLPDDPEKSVVGKDGELLYDFQKRKFDFHTKVTLDVEGGSKWSKQELASPRVPVVRTLRQAGFVEIVQEAFAAIPGKDGKAQPRYDVVLMRLRNTGDQPAMVRPIINMESKTPIAVAAQGTQITIGDAVRISAPANAAKVDDSSKDRVTVTADTIALQPGEERTFAITVALGKEAAFVPVDIAGLTVARSRADAYWTDGRIPYDRIQVPDPGIQALIDSSVRNIYQAREMKNGLPAFQVGPTCYRGLWIVDGAFLLEAATYIGCGDEARSGIQYNLSFQRPDGGFTLIPDYWKESGIILWTAARHARLTGDKQWLQEVWPKLERTFDFIIKLRNQASQDPKALEFGLVPPGFPDGGLAGKPAEYTNVYWTLAGMKAAVDAARWLDKTDQAARWQEEYDKMLAAFRKAAARDTRVDPHGNKYLPIVMDNAGNELPQRAQWAFCHAVFPGKVFGADDPLVRGNMEMLRATEREGMVYGTGWDAKGIWTYFASFYGHAWLWMGDGPKAVEVLYAFANHASPLLAWREEQSLVGDKYNKVGDMPHNWASAEFIRLVRHLLVLERDTELHIFEGLPRRWAMPGSVVRLKNIATEFGPLSLELVVAANGKTATLKLDGACRNPPERVVLHLGNWADPSNPKASVDLPVAPTIERTITISDK